MVSCLVVNLEYTGLRKNDETFNDNLKINYEDLKVEVGFLS